MLKLFYTNSTFTFVIFLHFHYFYPMTWICPNCNRSFRNANQSHSCMNVMAEFLFVGKNPELWEIYQKLLIPLKNLKGVKINPVKNIILLSVNTNFLAIKPKVNRLEIEFISHLKIDEFPVHKSVSVSKTKYANFIKLDNTSDVDKQLIDWLINAYMIDSKL